MGSQYGAHEGVFIPINVHRAKQNRPAAEVYYSELSVLALFLNPFSVQYLLLTEENELEKIFIQHSFNLDSHDT